MADGSLVYEPKSRDARPRRGVGSAPTSAVTPEEWAQLDKELGAIQPVLQQFILDSYPVALG